MAGDNGYFTWDDTCVRAIHSYELDPTWWSRVYEYPWALQYGGKGMMVADMGCGWMFRPLKNALALKCEHVYAVDSDPRLLDQALEFPDSTNISYVVADFSTTVGDLIPAGSLDRIFCISVLEDLADKILDVMHEFRRLLKPSGLIIVTFDTIWDQGKPLGPYPGLPITTFIDNVVNAGLRPRHKDGKDNWDLRGLEDRDLAVHNHRFNLCVVHSVLEVVE